jgi:hypothetical protein
MKVDEGIVGYNNEYNSTGDTAGDDRR